MWKEGACAEETDSTMIIRMDAMTAAYLQENDDRDTPVKRRKNSVCRRMTDDPVKGQNRYMRDTKTVARETNNIMTMFLQISALQSHRNVCRSDWKCFAYGLSMYAV